jgi:hypothetical protein
MGKKKKMVVKCCDCGLLGHEAGSEKCPKYLSRKEASPEKVRFLFNE